jgi:hypothetical protein
MSILGSQEEEEDIYTKKHTSYIQTYIWEENYCEQIKSEMIFFKNDEKNISELHSFYARMVNDTNRLNYENNGTIDKE